MAHIVKNKGRFVAVLPGSCKEDAQFRAWIVDHEPEWTEALRRPRRLVEPDDVYEITEAPWPSAEGYRGLDGVIRATPTDQSGSS